MVQWAWNQDRTPWKRKKRIPTDSIPKRTESDQIIHTSTNRASICHPQNQIWKLPSQIPMNEKECYALVPCLCSLQLRDACQKICPIGCRRRNVSLLSRRRYISPTDGETHPRNGIQQSKNKEKTEQKQKKVIFSKRSLFFLIHLGYCRGPSNE